MSSPIENRIGQVFVPVSDMQRAVAWYSKLLGLPVMESSHGGTIYDVPMQGETRLALDATPRQISNSSQPLFFFWTQDIQAAHDFLRAIEIQIVGQIENIGSVSFLMFKDPDNNLLMVCQRNA
jgi:predicted enzyme related to lactoylglutathione lyase